MSMPISVKICLRSNELTTAGSLEMSATDKIRQQFEKIMNGAIARDIDSIMAVYWKNDNLVEYDILPPVQFVGWDAVKTNYQNQIDAFHGQIEGTWEEPTIYTAGDLGYAFSLQHWRFDQPDGQRSAIDTRVSQLFRLIDGEWLVVHEHVSVPIDYLKATA